MNYRYELDGLRALAIALVLVFHFDLIPIVTGGFTGVDVFFVLSGFLITSITWPVLRDESFSLRDFYSKRVRRLLPALFTTVGLTILAGAFLLLPTSYENLATQGIASVLQVSNLFFWKTLNYFGFRADDTILLHTWSLAVEAQFYLFYPLFLLWIGKIVPRRAVTVLWGMTLVSLAINIFAVGWKPEATFYLPPTRLWEFTVGGLIALGVGQNVPHRMKFPLTALGLGLITAGAIIIDKTRLYPGAWALIPVLGTAAMIIGLSGSSHWIKRALTVRPVRYVGFISYSLYLVHWPILVFAIDASDEPLNYTTRAILCALSVGVASALYKFVETPLRRPRSSRGGLSPAVGYALSITMIVGLGMALQISSGWPQRFDSTTLKFANGANDRFTDQMSCEGDLRIEDPCLLGDPEKPVTVLVIGDSHALAAYGALDQVLSARGERGVLVFQHGCAPILNVQSSRHNTICSQHNDTIIRTHAKRFQSVYVASIFRQYSEPAYSPTGEKLNHDQLDSQLIETFDLLKRHEIRTVLMLPVPIHTVNVPDFLARSHQKLPSDRYQKDIEDYRTDNSRFLAAVEQIEVDEILSPADILCTPLCPLAFNGYALYSDNNHLSTAGSRFLGSRLAESPDL